MNEGRIKAGRGKGRGRKRKKLRKWGAEEGYAGTLAYGGGMGGGGGHMSHPKYFREFNKCMHGGKIEIYDFFQDFYCVTSPLIFRFSLFLWIGGMKREQRKEGG